MSSSNETMVLDTITVCGNCDGDMFDHRIESDNRNHDPHGVGEVSSSSRNSKQTNTSASRLPMAQKFEQSWNLKVGSEALLLTCVAGIVTQHITKLPMYQTSLGLLWHYWCGAGERKTLSEIGVKERVIELVKTPNQFGKVSGHSIQGDFIHQIVMQKSYNFRNNYVAIPARAIFDDIRIANDPLWAIGGATISGRFFGGVEKDVTGKYVLVGKIHYSLYDRFKDPYDVFNVIPIDIDPNGTPFDITDSWIEDIKEPLTPEQEHRYHQMRIIDEIVKMRGGIM